MQSINLIRFVGLPCPDSDQPGFSPEIVEFLAGLGLTIVLENGYGDQAGYSRAAYERACPNLQVGPRWQTFQTDLVLLQGQLSMKDVPLLRPGSRVMAAINHNRLPAFSSELDARRIEVIALPQGPSTDSQIRRLVEGVVGRAETEQLRCGRQHLAAQVSGPGPRATSQMEEAECDDQAN